MKFDAKTFLRLFFVWAFILLLFQTSWAQEITPIVDSLEIQQKASQMKAAPQGADIQLDDQTLRITTPKSGKGPQKIEKPSAIEQKVAESLERITLEEKIQQQIVKGTLQQFGYDLFTEVPTTFAPVTDIPVPSDYLIGSGDTFVVQLYGKKNVEYSLVVTRDGRLLVPELGPIQVSGLTFNEVKENLMTRFENRIIGAKAAITLGNLRTIRLIIVGDVVTPGNFTVSGLSTLMNAIIVSGGIKRTGSLRNIQVKRSGELVTRMDLYNVLLRGDTRKDIRLIHGDTIFIPPIGPTVGIGGEVKRPAIYELKSEKTVGDIIRLAGGLLPSADRTGSHIERIKEGQFHTLIDFDLAQESALETLVKPGDLIRIFPVSKSMDQVVLLSGHVVHPGGYQIKNNMRISDLIPSAIELQPNADIDFAILKREDRAMRKIFVRYVDLAAIFENAKTENDFRLNTRDELIVFDLSQDRSQKLKELVRDLKIQATETFPSMVFQIAGHVRYQGTFPLEKNARFLDVLNLSGGLLPGIDDRFALITRKIDNGKKIKMFAVTPSSARKEGLGFSNPIIYPEDKIYVFDGELDRSDLIKKDIEVLQTQTAFGDFAPVVFISGWVKHPGQYPLLPDMRISDLIIAGGGLKENTFGIGAEITRYELRANERRVAEHLFVHLDRVLSGETQKNYLLHPHDHLRLNKKPQWHKESIVDLAGEVVFPGKYPIKKGETLCSVIHRAGGFTETAYLHGSVFLRDNVRKKQQESLDRIQENLDDLLVQLLLSPSVNNTEKMPASERKQDTIRIIRQLKRAKAIGRMVIDLKGIENCEESTDFLLEDKDRLYVPKFANEVTVAGEVYFPTSHFYMKNRGCKDYIDLSGGPTVLARKDHVYVVQANGEVHSVRSKKWFTHSENIHVTPGATIYVPVNLDRINKLEKAQSWTQMLYHLAISAASLSYIIE